VLRRVWPINKRPGKLPAGQSRKLLPGQHAVKVEPGFNCPFDFGHVQHIVGFDFPIPFTCCGSSKLGLGGLCEPSEFIEERPGNKLPGHGGFVTHGNYSAMHERIPEMIFVPPAASTTNWKISAQWMC
jgi:hypothetical protein